MRRAVPEDFDLVNRLTLDAFGREIDPDDLARPDLWVSIDERGRAMCAVYVARDIGRWTAHATSMAVHSEHRGRGLGHVLVGELRRIGGIFARIHGPLRMFGYSNPSRGASVHLLAEHGWTHLGEALPDGSHLWCIDYPEDA